MFRRKRAISVSLREQGRALGMCDKVYEVWTGSESVDELCELYVKNMEFVTEHPEWNLNKVFKENSNEAIRHKHGIYIDEVATLRNTNDIVINGRSDITLVVDNSNVIEIYVRDQSNFSIELSNNSTAYIYVYDQSSVSISTDYLSKCFVYKYGGSVNSPRGNVKIRNREKF